MTAAELLAYLRAQGVVLWPDGDRLCYKAPKNVLTPGLRQELTEHKREILALLRQAKPFFGVSSLPLQPTSRDGKLPLSYAQHGLWLMAQMTHHPLFNQPLGFRIDGPLNVAVLERCLNEIIRRHEILRTTCSVVDGEPVQIVMPSYTLVIQTVDLRELTPNERESAAMRLATEETQQPFDLARGPLLRAKLFLMGHQSSVFMLTTHTFVSDGTSQGILLHEIGQLYAAFSKGELSPLPEHRIQFVDYAIWQRQMVQGQHFFPQMAYWKQQLRNSPSTLTWPVKNVSPTILTYRGETNYFSLPADLSESIRDFSRQEGVTVFTLLLAALKTLLYRLTEQTDLIVGTTVSNRTRSDLEALIGYFANNLFLRTQVSEVLTFRELLAQCQKVIADAFGHQDFPFEKLLEELSIDPEISQIPLLQVVFVLHDHVAEEDLQLPGLTIKEFRVQRGAAARHLHLHMVNAKGPLSGSLEYSTELFDRSTIDLVLDHFQSVLKCVISDPQQRLGSFPFLNKGERDELIRAWNNAHSKVTADHGTTPLKILKHDGPADEILPQTELERIIAAIWQEILEVQGIGLYQNFFDLGGRSIQIIRAHSRLQKALKREFSIIDLFKYPTIRSLSQYLGQEQGQQSLLRQSHDRTELLRLSRDRRIDARAGQQATNKQKEGSHSE
jgi:acyl carrier protein